MLHKNLIVTNKAIAKTFQELADIMELHGENSFKIRSYQNAYISLRKLEQPLDDLSDAEIAGIKGVGTAIAAKIRELLSTGKMETLEKYKEMTPPGVREMLHIAGFGPKKVLAVWKDLGVETIGELLYAVNENRLIELKGFGAKTQEDLRQKLEYYQKSRDKFYFAALEAEAGQLIAQIQSALPDTPVSLCGEIRRKNNVVNRIEVLIGKKEGIDYLFSTGILTAVGEEEGLMIAKTANEFPVAIRVCRPSEFGSKLFRYSASSEFMDAFIQAFPNSDFRELASEQAVFDKAKLPFIQPELREQAWAINQAIHHNLPHLIEDTDIRGVVHAHSTYSDGLHSLRDMALYCRQSGYAYLAITDHSKSAFYANGLQPERLLAQWQEIDALNAELAPFRIFKGIESDILNDGSLDYEEDLLKGFELIIASVHSNLRMDEEKATQRLLKAIENPYTSILGHPTGRLLLSRQGYTVNHPKIIDACAANKVSIELNANPYRLDLDWTWIPYALEKGVLISINPDAHSKEGIRDIHFGVCSARKGGLAAQNCLSAFDADEFIRQCKKTG